MELDYSVVMSAIKEADQKRDPNKRPVERLGRSNSNPIQF
jgi:hypothetical protein